MLEYQGKGAERRLYANTVEMTLTFLQYRIPQYTYSPKRSLTQLHSLRRHRSRSRRWYPCRRMTFLEVISICRLVRIYNLMLGTYHGAHNLQSLREKRQSIDNPCDIYNVVGCDQS